MARSSGSEDFPVGNIPNHPADDDVPPELIREELDRVLHSEEFRASKRSQEFLTYVVEHTLDGSSVGLKERTIGIEVFHRPPGYDTGDDATVRVKAGEVRKRLALYYATTGTQNPVRIELLPGTYVPAFRRPKAKPESPEFETLIAPATEPEPALPPPANLDTEPQRQRSGRYLWPALIALTLAVILGVFAWTKNYAQPTVLDQFWAPVLKDNVPVSLCVAYVPVYGLDREPTPSAPPRSDEFVQLKDQFVGAGDLIASVRLSSMLTRQHRPYSLKVGNEVSFHDIRGEPAILVGYSYTRWKEISSQMRFFIDGTRQPIGITDNGKATIWTLPNLPADRKTDHDYAIVSRVFNPDTNAMLVELAGITSYGTDAASEIVTNPDMLAEALRDAKEGWQHKNLQLVLSVKVIAGVPALPKVVASYFW